MKFTSDLQFFDPMPGFVSAVDDTLKQYLLNPRANRIARKGIVESILLTQGSEPPLSINNAVRVSIQCNRLFAADNGTFFLHLGRSGLAVQQSAMAGPLREEATKPTGHGGWGSSARAGCHRYVESRRLKV